MMLRRRTWFALAVAGLLTVFGALAWADPSLRSRSASAVVSEAERVELMGVVRDFNRVWQDFYASGGDPRLIDLIPASTDVKHHIFRDIGYLRDSGLVLIQDLARLLPREARRIGADELELIAYEEWNYQYQAQVTRKPAAELKGMGTGMKYTLKRTAGRWLVTHWERVAMESPPAEERPW